MSRDGAWVAKAAKEQLTLATGDRGSLGEEDVEHRGLCLSDLVRREPGCGKEKNVGLGSFASRLAKSAAWISFLLASVPAIAADNPSVPTEIVDLANKVDGVHPGFRAFHAKGIVVEGRFKASAEAAGFSRATLFNGSSIPVIARFSDGSGMPTVPDGSPAMPRGIAIRYHLPGGHDTDMVTNSFKF